MQNWIFLNMRTYIYIFFFYFEHENIFFYFLNRRISKDYQLVFSIFLDLKVLRITGLSKKSKNFEHFDVLLWTKKSYVSIKCDIFLSYYFLLEKYGTSKSLSLLNKDFLTLSLSLSVSNNYASTIVTKIFNNFSFNTFLNLNR